MLPVDDATPTGCCTWWWDAPVSMTFCTPYVHCRMPILPLICERGCCGSRQNLPTFSQVWGFWPSRATPCDDQDEVSRMKHATRAVMMMMLLLLAEGVGCGRPKILSLGCVANLLVLEWLGIAYDFVLFLLLGWGNIAVIASNSGLLQQLE